MPKNLTKEIVKYIFSQLGITNPINNKFFKSLLDNDFILSEKISFEIDNKIVKKNIWGCQLTCSDQAFKMLVTDCSQDTKEYYLISQLKDCPAYGLSFNEDGNYTITYYMNSIWLPCNIYMQATFLAGMEQLKNISITFDKCTEYQEQYNLLLEFINYLNSEG
jgi:hypothetical protein